MNILIKNTDVITGISNNMFIKDANIGIADGCIKFIRKSDENMPNFLPEKIIDGSKKVIMSGLINTHTHSPMTILRNHADDLNLEEWLFNRIFPIEAKTTKEDIYWGTKLAVTEMIKSGTTSFADMYFYIDVIANVVRETGIRANLAVSPFVTNGRQGNIQSAIQYFNSNNNSCNGRLKVYIQVHSVYLCNEQNLRMSSDLAKQLNTGIQIHLQESNWEIQEAHKRYGVSSIEACNKYGIFDVPTVAAHCVYLSDSDVEILKEKNVSVAHNPTSNLKLGNGIAPISKLLKEGVNVSLGTDGAASNNNLNMFEEINLSALLQKGVNCDPTLVNAKQALLMATANGAKAIGFENEVGMIKEGMKADLILIDIDKPHFYPINNLVSAVVYSAQASDVDTVIVDGDILMEGRCLTTIDEEEVKFKANEIFKKLNT